MLLLLLLTLPLCCCICCCPLQDHNEPTLDEMSLAQYADLRSFQLQLNRQFINYRLPLRESRGPTPGEGVC